MRSLHLALSIAVLAVLAWFATGCPTASPAPVPPGGTEPFAAEPVPAPVAVPSVPDAIPVAPPDAGAREIGSDIACTAGAECPSGVCEGRGCGAEMGRCAPAARSCTRDRRPYCGCNGATFFASGNCPGQLYAYPGRCQGGTGGGLAEVGGDCTSAASCKSGICEGLGCGDDQSGVCVARDRVCTADLVAYCGCDGATFKASSTCASVRYRSRGTCR